jgi:peptidoglycan-associated lipoprotein
MLSSSRQKILIVGVGLSLAVFAAGCKKKTPVATPPPPPAAAPATPAAPMKAAAPAITQFTAEPTTIQRGQSSTLRWEISGDITGVSIDQSIGAVQNTGNRRVFPQDSTTYMLTATGGGGTSTASVTVTVSAPPPPPPPTPTENPKTVVDRIGSELQDGFFDYDSTSLRSDAQSTLTQDATALKSILGDFPSAAIVIEGHCDERGSAEYNLGLGDRRASSARDFLVQLGVPADKIHTISYGKERPQCTESTESCWQKNRRVHFSPGQ